MGENRCVLADFVEGYIGGKVDSGLMWRQQAQDYFSYNKPWTMADYIVHFVRRGYQQFDYIDGYPAESPDSRTALADDD